MINYFEKFPRVDYPYQIPSTSIGKVYATNETVDMSVRFTVVERILKYPTAYYEYYWKDEDRVDILAKSYYGDANLAWLVLLSAEAFDWLYDLPLTPLLFDEYLKNKYQVDDVNKLRRKLHHYEDISSTIIDEETYLLLNDFNKREVMIYDYEEQLNESKRTIKLISKIHVKDILNEFEVKMQEIKNNRRLFQQ